MTNERKKKHSRSSRGLKRNQKYHIHVTLCLSDLETKPLSVSLSNDKQKKNAMQTSVCVRQTRCSPVARSQTAGAMPIAGTLSANALPGGLQNANMASIELGKKRMRDSNDDLLMVPRLMHVYTFSVLFYFFIYLFIYFFFI